MYKIIHTNVTFLFYNMDFSVLYYAERFKRGEKHLFCYCNEGHSSEFYYIQLLMLKARIIILSVIVAWIFFIYLQICCLLKN